jgi:hypothetical protein
VISNKTEGAPETITHESAKGLNHLATRDIVSVLLHVGPEQFEQLEAINAYCGTKTAIRMYHVDQLNQSLGRNKGFRAQGAEHRVVMTHGLFVKCFETLMLLSRYDFRLRVGAGQRRNMLRLVRPTVRAEDLADDPGHDRADDAGHDRGMIAA